MPALAVKYAPNPDPHTLTFATLTTPDSVPFVEGTSIITENHVVIRNGQRCFTATTGTPVISQSIMTSTGDIYFSNGTSTTVSITEHVSGLYTYEVPGSVTFTGMHIVFKEDDPKTEMANLIRSRIKSNIVINVNHRCRLDYKQHSPAELKARDTLRDMLTERDWRRYLTNRFIIVKGASSYWYQIFADRYERIRVYKDGKLTHRICIHSDNSCPPTDHVINMKLMIEFDEIDLWRSGNVHQQDNHYYSSSSGLTFTGKLENILDSYRKLKGEFATFEGQRA